MTCLKLFLLLCALKLPGLYGATAPLPSPPEVWSLAGGGRGAIGKGPSHPLINPAGFAHFPTHQGQIFYVWQTSPYWGLSGYEKKPFPLALTWIKVSSPNHRILNASVSGFVAKGWSLGVRLTHLKDSKKKHLFNASGGVLIRPPYSPLSVGATWDCILPLKGPFEGQRKQGLGVEYRWKPYLFLRGDLIYQSDKKWSSALGGELILSRIFILQMAGHINLHSRNFFYSGGMGIKGQKLQVDYHFKQTQPKGWIHALSLSVLI